MAEGGPMIHNMHNVHTSIDVDVHLLHVTCGMHSKSRRHIILGS